MIDEVSIVLCGLSIFLSHSLQSLLTINIAEIPRRFYSHAAVFITKQFNRICVFVRHCFSDSLVKKQNNDVTETPYCAVSGAFVIRPQNMTRSFHVNM